MKSKIHNSTQNYRKTNKYLILSFAFIFTLTSLFSFSQNQDTGITITVTVDNLKNNTGQVIFSLHTEATFMKGKGIMDTTSAIKDGKVSITFKNVKPGDYAILGLHDENENGEIDFKENGMPLESYGMSNNVMSFGPPQYLDGLFIVKDKDLNMNIKF